MNAVRKTSAEAYHVERLQGTLGERQYEVLCALLAKGPTTGAELNVALGFAAHKRLSELRDMGLVREITRSKCQITRKKAIIWEAVPNAHPRREHASKPVKAK